MVTGELLKGFEPLASGPVPAGSALAEFLAGRVLGDVLSVHCRPRFRLRRIGGSPVLRCDEEQTHVSLALKCYDLKHLDGSRRSGDLHDVRVGLMRTEFDNIRLVRKLGLDQPPLRAVRPLAVEPELGCLLVEEYVSGEDLHSAVQQAAWHGERALLAGRLAQVAAFLARLHNVSASRRDCDPHEPVAYLDKVTRQLREGGVISADEGACLALIGRDWAESGDLRARGAVLVHGDATPTQFLFPAGDELVAVDFERLHYADRAADIGRLGGELKHLFAKYAGDPWASEPFIQGFYRDYCQAAPGAGDFGWLMQRARFHMACSELRIARNTWEEIGHRRWLAAEARQCLSQ
jgi:aminoglycoside phosphotransferase (APT) family kinase protein